jgi:hypothetical protein
MKYQSKLDFLRSLPVELDLFFYFKAIEEIIYQRHGFFRRAYQKPSDEDIDYFIETSSMHILAMIQRKMYMLTSFQKDATHDIVLDAMMSKDSFNNLSSCIEQVILERQGRKVWAAPLGLSFKVEQLN